MSGHCAPTVHAAGYTVLRGDPNGRLTRAALHSRAWGLSPGSRQILALISVKSWDGDVAGHIARMMFDAEVAHVHIQGTGYLADRFAGDVQRAISAYTPSRSGHVGGQA